MPPGRDDGDEESEETPDLRLVGRDPRMGVGELIRSIRRQPRPGHPKGLSIKAAAGRTQACAQGPVSVRTWSRVEHGHSHPRAPSLLCMSLAVEATTVQIRDLFHRAGYGLLFDTLAATGAISRRRPGPAEAGIMSDPRLPYDKRRMLLDHLKDIVDAAENRARLQREQEEEEEREKDRANEVKDESDEQPDSELE